MSKLNILYESSFKTEGLHGIEKSYFISKDYDSNNVKPFSLYDKNGSYRRDFEDLDEIIGLMEGEEKRLKQSDLKSFQRAAKWMNKMVVEIRKIV